MGNLASRGLREKGCDVDIGFGMLYVSRIFC